MGALRNANIMTSPSGMTEFHWGKEQDSLQTNLNHLIFTCDLNGLLTLLQSSENSIAGSGKGKHGHWYKQISRWVTLVGHTHRYGKANETGYRQMRDQSQITTSVMDTLLNSFIPMTEPKFGNLQKAFSSVMGERLYRKGRHQTFYLFSVPSRL